MSIRIGIIFIATAAALLTIGAGGAVMWAFSSAEAQLQRAVFSYQQLANATTLDGAASRLLLDHFATTHYDKRFSDAAIPRTSVINVIANTNAHIQSEIAAIDDPIERAAEHSEFLRIDTLGRQYALLEQLIDETSSAQQARHLTQQQTNHLPQLISAYRENEALLQSFIDDENQEVSAAAQALRLLRSQLRGYIIGIVVTVLLLIVGFAWFLYRLLMNPMQVLMNGADRYATGALEQPIMIQSPPEFAELSGHFNHMATTLLAQKTQLQTHNRALEQAVSDRTQELEEKASSLARIDQSRRLFFAKVGHELRTPLTVILAEAEVGANTEKDLRSTLLRIKAHGQMLNRRIKDLLALARSDRGELSLEMAPLEVAPMLQQVISVTDIYADALAVELVFDIKSSNDLEMIGDRDWLSHALTALIDNALKHAPQSSRVTITVSQTPSSWHFNVEDEGLGVDPDILPQLTQPYFQGDDRGSRLGTGLGLAVVSWVVEKHRGELLISNRPSGGLSALVKLPHLG